MNCVETSLSERISEPPPIVDIQMFVIGPHVQYIAFNILHDRCVDHSKCVPGCSCVEYCRVGVVCSCAPLLTRIQTVEVYEAEEKWSEKWEKHSYWVRSELPRHLKETTIKFNDCYEIMSKERGGGVLKLGKSLCVRTKLLRYRAEADRRW